MNIYEPIIGMEIHVELKTKSKMFCGCKNDPFFAKQPNIYTCPVCLGLPGGLPVPNKKAVEWTILLGLALGAKIPEESKFDRKNYFYPDLSKGYQISQYDMPLCLGGLVKTDLGDVRIRRVHLEEDTGKLLHTSVDGKQVTLVDFNRSGVPLVEIVTEPDIHSGEHAKVFLKKLYQIVRYLDISDADMEKGSMRLEPNISVRREGDKGLPNYKVEVKNINSFNFVKKAIEYEVGRHSELLQNGETPVQETRGWNDNKGVTVSQRRKEEADDYRYFPEPDIPPMRFTQNLIRQLADQIPELPDAKKERFAKEYGLGKTDIDLLLETKQKADYFEEAVQVVRHDSGNQSVKLDQITPKVIANWLINRGIDIDEVLPAAFVSRIVQATTVASVDEKELARVIKQILTEQPKAVADYKNGKEQALMFLVGQVKKHIKVSIDLEIVKKFIMHTI